MNSTIVASILVLLGSIGLGIGTGLFAHKLGSESLTGVKSPSENPSQKIKEVDNQKSDLSKKKDFKIIEEKRMIITVYDYVQQQRNLAKGVNKKLNQKKNQQESKAQKK